MINLFWPITNQMQKIYMRTIYPTAFSITFVRSDNKGDIMALVYTLEAGPVTVSDVTSRKLTVTVNGSVVSENSFPKETVSFGEFSFADNDKVTATLVDIDDAGNVSQPAVVEFVAADTLAPPVPGEFGAKLVREQ
jgi:hypothetical protein